MHTKTYVEKHKDRFISELIDLLKIPSISADSQYTADVKAASEMVAKQLKESGCDKVEIFPLF